MDLRNARKCHTFLRNRAEKPKYLTVRSEETLHFIANGVYSDKIGGGDVHFGYMAQGAMKMGFHVHFFGGHALERQLGRNFPDPDITLTDGRQLSPFIDHTVCGQARMFGDYLIRCCRTLFHLNKIKRTDPVYACSDIWFDVIPILLCRARSKLMILGMDAPRFGEIIRRSRPDVPRSRLASFHYAFSQWFALRAFRFCRNKKLFYVHPTMRERLLALGYDATELVFISNGVDVEMAEAIPAQPKHYDVIWIGRVHAQKGIDEMFQTLVYLRDRIKNFSAVLVGRLEADLRPRVEQLGLTSAVTFTGFVSDEEKLRLFKASRLLIMPSHYESWGIVVGEALACGTPVVAYELSAYRPIFGNLVEYVPCFDAEAFKNAALRCLENARLGKLELDKSELHAFKAAHSWQAAQCKFVEAVQDVAQKASAAR
jgi:glycosyltransferase involved in cell wall biosynthesis